MAGKSFAGDRLFGFFNGFFLILIAVICIMPIWYTFNISILPYTDYLKDPTHLKPLGITLINYENALHNPAVWRAFGNGVFVLTGTVVLALFTCIVSAYILTRKKLPGRRFFVLLFIIPMFFGGGLVPTYLVWKQLHLTNSLWGLMLAGCLNGYWMLILKATMENLPDGIEESARMDGANDLEIIWYIMIPLSKATLACIALMVGVGKWNEFFWAQIVMQDPAKYTFMVYLRSMFARVSALQSTAGAGLILQSNTVSYQMAIVIIGLLPILVIYPLVQRYFVKGILVGAIKA